MTKPYHPEDADECYDAAAYRRPEESGDEDDWTHPMDADAIAAWVPADDPILAEATGIFAAMVREELALARSSWTDRPDARMISLIVARTVVSMASRDEWPTDYEDVT